MHKKISLIGGEVELNDTGSFFYLTDSGRSSLRLIILSGLRNKKFLLPDYLCKAVLDVLNDCDVKYDFYHINQDFTFNEEEIRKKKFDVIYLINYFGMPHEGIGRIVRNNTIVIDDSVFSPLVVQPFGIKRWIGFNSLRKISPLAEGSMIRSTLELNEKLILNEEAPFIRFKYMAKKMKHAYLKNGAFSQKKYLEFFSKGEKLIDNQRQVYSISNKGNANLLDFYKDLNNEFETRKKNFNLLDLKLKNYAAKISPKFHSFYVLNINRREMFKKFLFGKKIFLPVHWPKTGGLNNVLYDRLISIPVDSRYGRSDMERISKLTLGILSN